jgi:hypothetical protein
MPLAEVLIGLIGKEAAAINEWPLDRQSRQPSKLKC